MSILINERRGGLLFFPLLFFFVFPLSRKHTYTHTHAGAGAFRLPDRPATRRTDPLTALSIRLSCRRDNSCSAVASRMNTGMGIYYTTVNKRLNASLLDNGFTSPTVAIRTIVECRQGTGHAASDGATAATRTGNEPSLPAAVVGKNGVRLTAALSPTATGRAPPVILF